jgi:hypothetical protein
MAKDEQPTTPVPTTPLPSDPGNPQLTLAMELAQFVKEEIGNMETRVSAQIGEAMNTNAATVKRMGELESSVKNLELNLERRAEDRANKEVAEAAARYKIALDHKGVLDTQEKIEVGRMVEDRLAADKKARAIYLRGLYDKVLPNVVTGVVMIVVGPVALGIFIAILVFILRALGIDVPFPAGDP